MLTLAWIWLMSKRPDVDGDMISLTGMLDIFIFIALVLLINSVFGGV